MKNREMFGADKFELRRRSKFCLFRLSIERLFSAQGGLGVFINQTSSGRSNLLSDSVCGSESDYPVVVWWEIVR